MCNLHGSGVGGASDAESESGVSVTSSTSSEYNELQMKCRAYQEELTEVHKLDTFVQ